MKTNQKGFAVVEVLLILVGLAVVGYAGYYVYSSNKDSKPQESANSNTQDTDDESEEITEVDIPEIVGETKNISHFGQSYSFTLPEKWSFVEKNYEDFGEYNVSVGDPTSSYHLNLMIQSVSPGANGEGGAPRTKSLEFTGPNSKKNYVVNSAVTDPTLLPQLFISTCEVEFCHNVLEKDKYILNIHVERVNQSTDISMANKEPISLEDPTVIQILAIIGTVKYP